MRVRLTKSPSAATTQVVSAAEKVAIKPMTGVLRAWRRKTTRELDAETRAPPDCEGQQCAACVLCLRRAWFQTLPVAANFHDAVRKGGHLAFLSDDGEQVITSRIETISLGPPHILGTTYSSYTIDPLPPPRPPPYRVPSQNSPVPVRDDETSRVKV